MSVFDSQASPQEEFQKDNSIGQEGKFAVMRVGAGSSGGGFTKDGFFVGGESFDTAKYRQDYSGKIEVYNASGDLKVVIDPNG